MKKNLFTLLAICCLAAACDDDAEKITLLSYKVVDPLHNAERRWLYAANANGDVLATREITTAGDFTLEGAVSGEHVDIGYAVMYPSNSGEKKIWYFYLYKGIEVGTSIEVGRTFPSGSPTGTARVRVTNYDEAVSPLSNLMYSATFAGSIKAVDWTAGVVNAELYLGDAPSEVLVTGLRDNTPVYFKKQNVSAGETVDADFTSFVPMENIQRLDFTGYTATAGFRTAEPYSYYSNYENTRVTGQALTDGLIAYVPGYDNYQTFISNSPHANGVDLRVYLKRGSPATSFNFPDATISVSDENLSSFNAQISLPYTYKEALFTFAEGEQAVTLSVYSGSDGASDFTDFPAEFKKIDPALKASDLSYHQVSFLASGNTYTITDDLKVKLSNISKQAAFEYYAFTKVR